MKWFKHDTDCDRSEGLSFLIDQEGFSGYGRWFRLLEIVAEKMDKTDRCHAEYSIQKWCSLLGLKQKKLISFLELTENKLKTKVFSYENIIKIEIPNLLNKRDNYTKDFQETSKKLPSKNKIKKEDTETDKEEDMAKEIPCVLYGENKLVYLSDGDYEKLKQKLNGLSQDYIERLDGYIAQIGVQAASKKYKSHYATMLNWHRKDVKEGKIKQEGENDRFKFQKRN